MCIKKFTLHAATPLIVGILVAIFVRTLIIEPFYVPSGSMRPTLWDGDCIIVTKYNYGIGLHSLPITLPQKILNLESRRFMQRLPQRGDVIVFKNPIDSSKRYIKRVLALPNDKIMVSEGKVYLNGKMLPQTKDKDFFFETEKKAVPMFKERSENKEYDIIINNVWDSISNTTEFIVPDNHVFVMGDNRNESVDSRSSIGPVDMSLLIGKARFISISFSKNGRGNFMWGFLRTGRFFNLIS